MPLTASIVAIAPELGGTPYAYANGAGTFQRGNNLYIVCTNPAVRQTFADGNPPPVLAQAHVLKSTDNGATWNEIDLGNGPTVSVLRGSGNTARGCTTPVGACYQDADTLLVAYFVWDYSNADPIELRFSVFDLITETWGAETSGGPTIAQKTFGIDTAVSIAYRPLDGAIIVLYQSYQTISSQAYARTFYVTYEGAVWGSATAVDSAQTGASFDYKSLGAVSGDSSRTHLFYQVLDVNQIVPGLIYQNSLTAGDALVGPVQAAALGVFGVGTTAVNRVFGGVTSIFVGWFLSDGVTIEFRYSKAASANTPAFSDFLVETVNVNAGPNIFNCGQAVSTGISAAYVDSDLETTGAADLVTWDTPIPLTLPFPGVEPQQFSGLGVDLSGSVFPSAGIVGSVIQLGPE